MTTNEERAATPGAIDYNPLDPAHLEDPYPVYARARREQPVFHSPVLDLWVVTRYADIVEVEKNPAVFSSVGALDARTEPHPEVRAALSEGYVKFLALVQSDPPDHTRIRAVFGKALSPQRVAALEPSIRATADALIDGFVRDGEADLVRQFAYLLSGSVVCDLLGVPRSDLGQLKRWSDDKQILMAAHESVERQVECARGFVALQRYFADHLEDRRQRPRDDLLTLLVPSELGGTAALSHQEAVCNAIDLLAAGHETTTDLISNGTWLLLHDPLQMQALRDDPGLIPNAIEEMLRMEAPVHGFFRSVTADADVGGVTVPKGARVFIVYGSGNRDEAQFSDPDRLDIRRADAKNHLAFGKGIHFCVGSVLARLEGRVAFEHLLRRLPNLRKQAGKAAVRRPYIVLRGFEHLPIAWDVPADA